MIAELEATAARAAYKANLSIDPFPLAHTCRVLGLAPDYHALFARGIAVEPDPAYDRTLEQVAITCTIDPFAEPRPRDNMPTQDVWEYAAKIQQLVQNSSSTLKDAIPIQLTSPTNHMRTFSGGILWCFSHDSELYFVLLKKDGGSRDYNDHGSPALGYPNVFVDGEWQPSSLGVTTELYRTDQTCCREGLEEMLFVVGKNSQAKVLVPKFDGILSTFNSRKIVEEATARLGLRFEEEQYTLHPTRLLYGNDTLTVKTKFNGNSIQHTMQGFAYWGPPCSADFLMIGYLGEINPAELLVYDGEGFERDAILVSASSLKESKDHFVGKQGMQPIIAIIHRTVNGQRQAFVEQWYPVLLPQAHRVLDSLVLTDPLMPYLEKMAQALARGETSFFTPYSSTTLLHGTLPESIKHRIALWGNTLHQFDEAIRNGARY